MSKEAWWFKTHDFLEIGGCVYCDLTKREIMEFRIVCYWTSKRKKVKPEGQKRES